MDIINTYYTRISDEAQEKAVLSLSGKHKSSDEKITAVLPFAVARRVKRFWKKRDDFPEIS